MFKKLNVFLFSLVASLFVQSTFAMEQCGPKGLADEDYVTVHIIATEDLASEGANYDTLRIINENLGATEFEALVALIKANKTITSIDASGTEITDEQLETILVQCSNRIEILTCCGCKHIRKLHITCPNLQHLLLSHCCFLQDLYIDCPMLQKCTLLSCPIDIIHGPDRSTLLRHQFTPEE